MPGISMTLDGFFQTRGWRAFRRFFARSYLHAGLTLLAWGTDDIGGFMANPARETFIGLVLVQSLIQAWQIYHMPPQPPYQPDFYKPRYQAELFEIIFILTAYGDRHGALTWSENAALRWAGVVLYAIGSMLAVAVIQTWSSHQRREGARACTDPVLLCEGLYRFIRYPGLLTQVIYCLGFALIFRSWVGLALMLPLLVVTAVRIEREDAENAGLFPRVWASRQATSRRFIPFIY